MLLKLFHRKEEKKEPSCEWHENLDDFQAAPRLPKFDKSKIRVLIFRDCDKTGKNVLFDSDHAARVNNQQLKASSDVKMLGEMIFGSVAMLWKGSILKIHQIRTPPQLLLSKVFALKSRSANSMCSDADSSASFTQSDTHLGASLNTSSESIAIPRSGSSPLPGSSSKQYRPVSSQYGSPANMSICSVTSLDSLYRSDSLSSLYTPSSMYTPSPSPGGSLQRRWHRSRVTSLDFGNSFKSKGNGSDEVLAASRRQPKIGIGIIFKLWENADEKCRTFQNFFFSHYTLFEAHLQKLRLAIEKTFYLKKSFFNASAMEAVETFKEEVMTFYSSPRILEPVWLNMMSSPQNQQSDVDERFISTLMKSIDLCDSKETNCFLSSLLTAVLTHHLAWVPTVSPSGAEPIRTYLDKHSSKSLDVLAKCHPYNPLWAQLGDLYGTIGFPLKISRTVVTGKDPTLVRQILFILTYFIRCSDVKEHTLRIKKESVDTESLDTLDTSRSLSRTPCSTPSARSWKESLWPDIAGSDNENAYTDTSENKTSITDDLGPVEDNECLRSFLININFIDDNNLKNLQRSTKKKTISSSSKKSISEDYTSETDDDKENFPPNIKLEPSFKCYCCSDRTRNGFSNKNMYSKETDFLNSTGSNSSMCHEIRRVNTVDSVLHSDTASVSSLDLDKRDSGFSSDCTNDCLCREPRSLDLDSDYSSLANEEFTSSHEQNGIVSETKCLEESQETVESGDALCDDLLSMNLMELPLLSSKEKKTSSRPTDNKVEPHNFGRSLLAGYCDGYVSDFALHGAKSVDSEQIAKDLQFSIKHSVVDESIADSACIVADTDTWTIQVWTLSRTKDTVMHSPSENLRTSSVIPSNLVSAFLDSTKGLWDMNIPTQFCLMHVEDGLKDIYSKSKVLAEYIKARGQPVSRQEIEDKFRYRGSDIDLLLATAGAHSPYVSCFTE